MYSFRGDLQKSDAEQVTMKTKLNLAMKGAKLHHVKYILYLSSRNHLKLQLLRSSVINDTVSVQILQTYIYKHTQALICIYVYTYMIYIHICTGTCITYIYSNLLHLEPKK